MSVPICKCCQSPAVVYMRGSGTLLIFAECRKMCRKLSSWLDLTRGVLKQTLGQVSMEWTQAKMLTEALLDGHCSVNPCAVYDEKTNKLFLFFTCIDDSQTNEWLKDHCSTKTRLCYVTSQDCGENWSQVTDLTGCLPENCITFSVGSGHGLQTEDGKLIVPACLYTNEENVDGKLVPHAVPLYSDNGGESWQFGLLPKKSTKNLTAEVWVDGGRFVYCNTSNQQGLRVEAIRDVNGDTFTIPSSGNPDTPPGCQGSVISFPAQNLNLLDFQMPNKWLLFSHPIGNPESMDLAAFLNKTPFDPKAWSKPWIIKTGVSGRSDLAYMDFGYFACVFEENGKISSRVFHIHEIK